MADLEIDYSQLAPTQTVILDEEWEPPQHRFFGKRLENGKQEKEPVYVHKEYPRLFYSLQGDKIVAKLVNSDSELEKLGKGWEKNPSAFGYISAPSFEQIQEINAQKDAEKSYDKAALIAEAKSLGIDAKGTWGVAKLLDEIDLAKQKAA